MITPAAAAIYGSAWSANIGSNAAGMLLKNVQQRVQSSAEGFGQRGLPGTLKQFGQAQRSETGD